MTTFRQSFGVYYDIENRCLSIALEVRDYLQKDELDARDTERMVLFIISVARAHFASACD